MDSIGRLFIADTENHRIRMVGASNNIITTVAGTGTTSPFNGNHIPATLANLYNPHDVKGDTAGNLYIADWGSCSIRIVDSSGMITTLFGTLRSCGYTAGTASRTSSITNPRGIWLDSLATVYFSNDFNAIHRGIVVSSPTSQPSEKPSGQPSSQPSNQPVSVPTCLPTDQPASRPTTQPSVQPSSLPSKQPVPVPTCLPTSQPSMQPYGRPTAQPSGQPSSQPSKQPVSFPTCVPTGQPSSRPSAQPSRQSSAQSSIRSTKSFSHWSTHFTSIARSVLFKSFHGTHLWNGNGGLHR
jgi:hypothetical protein